MPPRSRLVRVPTGLRLHVREWEPERGDAAHTLFVLHGFLDHGGAFADLIERGLDARFHVVAPDFRGHGDSDRIGSGGYYHFLDYVADLHGLVEALGRERVSIVAHSMGGNVATYYAGSFPARIAKLALLEGLVGPPDRGDTSPERLRGWVAGWWKQAGATPRALTLDEAAQRLMANDPQIASLDAGRRLAAAASWRGPDGLYRWKHDPLHLTSGPYGYRYEVLQLFQAEVRCPLLVVDGGASEWRHADAQLSPRKAGFVRAASVESVTLAGAGHMLHRHNAAELAPLLLRFLSDESAQPTSSA